MIFCKPVSDIYLFKNLYLLKINRSFFHNCRCRRYLTVKKELIISVCSGFCFFPFCNQHIRLILLFQNHTAESLSVHALYYPGLCQNRKNKIKCNGFALRRLWQSEVTVESVFRQFQIMLLRYSLFVFFCGLFPAHRKFKHQLMVFFFCFFPRFRIIRHCRHRNLFSRFKLFPDDPHVCSRINHTAVPADIQIGFESLPDFTHLLAQIQRFGKERNIHPVFKSLPEFSHLLPVIFRIGVL